MAENNNENDVGYSVSTDQNNSRWEEIYDFMDAFNDEEKFCKNTKPSILLRSGRFAMQKKNRIQNPDWMAQSAHSFREIHYRYWDSKSLISKIKRKVILVGIKYFKYQPQYIPKTRTDSIRESLKTYVADESRRQELAKLINKIHVAFTNIAHHFKKHPSLKETLKTLELLKIIQGSSTLIEEESYEKLVDHFENFLLEIKPRSIGSHKIIDQLITSRNFDAQKIKAICFSGGSLDARLYFFSKVDESWLTWIYNEGFLSALQEPSEDPTRYSYSLPELGFLVRMAEIVPEIVVNVILSIPISKEKMNPEVIDRFTWIISNLPAEQSVRLLPNVLEENWVGLMASFKQSGHEFKKVVSKLVEKKDFESLNTLLQIILTLREQPEPDSGYTYVDDNYLFALRDISDTEIFKAIADESNNRLEESFNILIGLLSKIVICKNPVENEVFEISEPFLIRDTNLFTIDLDDKKRTYSRSDLKNLIVATRIIAERLFKNSCEDEVELERLYETYISPLPDSYTLWRFRLVITSLCPDKFRSKLKDLFFRPFNVGERYFEIEGGAEYHQFLSLSFGAMDESDQREYIAKVFEYFGASLADKDKESWRHRDGLEILDYIADKMTDGEMNRAETIFGTKPVLGRHTPEPSIGEMRGGRITPKAHIDPSDFTIDEIIEHLKSDWKPEILNKEFKDDDFLSPRGVQGLGDALRADFKIRIDEYFPRLTEFFNRELIDPSYLNSFLRDIDETLRNKIELTNEQGLVLLDLFELIKISGENEKFIKAEERTWLADWITVHRTSADILLGILQDTKSSEWFKQNRVRILEAIKYLLTIESSPSPDEDDPKFGEPYHVAINSVRGQAYIAFVQFAYNDGKTLSTETKELFESVLNSDTSNPIRFLIGHYLATFFFRDKSFIKKLFPKIFPKEVSEKEKLYFASWEGYLSNTLYGELFDELRDYYQYAITLSPDSYPDREYFKGLDETLAVHLALKYAHFDLGIDDPLFVSFWSTPNATRHYEFISFIGRSCITRSQAGDKWLEDNNVSKERLLELWVWILETEIPLEPKVFSGFGFWINPDKEILQEKLVIKNLTISLKKSAGELDWDYGLMKRIQIFAEIDSINALEIIVDLLLLDGELNPNRRAYFGTNSEIKTALQTIYVNPSLKPKVKELINTLIEKGSNAFWDLKDILD